MFQVESCSGHDVLPIAAGGYVPPESNVVSGEVLAVVFEDKPLPFNTNSDGSVDLNVYMQWLANAGQAALLAFEECSDAETPVEQTELSA